jgi:hypothetical protein
MHPPQEDAALIAVAAECSPADLSPKKETPVAAHPSSQRPREQGLTLLISRHDLAPSNASRNA